MMKKITSPSRSLSSLLLVLAALSAGWNPPYRPIGCGGIVLALAAATTADRTAASASRGEEAEGVGTSSFPLMHGSARRRLPLRASHALPSAAMSSSSSAAHLQRNEQQPRQQQLRRRLGKDKETEPQYGQPSATPIARTSPSPTSSPTVGAVVPAPQPTSPPNGGGEENGGGGAGGGNSPPTAAPASDPAPSTATVSLLEFVVTYDSSSESETDVLASLNETLFRGFSAMYDNTKKVRLTANDPGMQQQPAAAGDAGRRVLQTTSLSVTGKVTFSVASAPAPSDADVHALQSTLLKDWQEGSPGTSVTFPEANGGNDSTSASASSSGNAGLIAGLVVAAVVAIAIGAFVVRRRYQRRSQSPAPRRSMQVEILSEINEDDYDDDIEGVPEKRSTEHADCDIEIEQLDASKGGVVMVTTSPSSTDTGSSYAQFSPSSAAGGKNPDNVYLAGVSKDGDGSSTVAASLTDSESKKRQSKALSSLLTFFARQSKKDDTASVASSILSDPRMVQMAEPEEKKDDEEVEATLDPPAPEPNAVELTTSPSLDSMEDYSLASASLATASFGPQPAESPTHPANKWLSGLRARAPSAESYHSDSESMFTYGEVGASSEAAVAAPAAARALFVSHEGEPGLLGAARDTGSTPGEDDSSADEIMTAPRSWRLTPKRGEAPSSPKQKKSPTSCLSPIGTPHRSTTRPSGKSRGDGRVGDGKEDEDEPFDEMLEDEQDLEVFAAELERAKARLHPVHPDFSPPRDGGKSSSLRSTPVTSNSGKDRAANVQSSGSGPGSIKSSSSGSSSGAHEETLAEFLRHKRGETRTARDESRRERQARMTAM